jgi:hypothetical protein
MISGEVLKHMKDIKKTIETDVAFVNGKAKL